MSEWFDVKEKLPELYLGFLGARSKEVICKFLDGSILAMSLCRDVNFHREDGLGDLYWKFEHKEFIPRKATLGVVTHWRHPDVYDNVVDSAVKYSETLCA